MMGKAIMSSDVSFGQLASRAVRSAIGVRNFKAKLQRKSTDAQGFIQWLWNGADQLGGWILSTAFKIVGGTVVGALQAIFGLFNFTWNFNWNQSDEEINQAIEQRRQAILTRLGGATGKSLGYIVGATGTTAAIAVFNQSLAANALIDAIPELTEELLVEWGALCQLVAQSAIQSFALGAFKNTRNFIKWYAEFYRGYIPEQISNGIANWGKPGSKPWSFAQGVEDLVDLIPIQWLREPIKELIEEFGEAVQEAAYVVGASADAKIAEQKLANRVAPPMGDMQFIEVVPNRANPEEKYILAGSEELIKQELTAIVADNQLLSEKDVGMVFSANPAKAEENVRYQPMLHLQFKETKDDMWQRQDDRELEGEISLRLVNYTSETITQQYLQTLAETVKQKLATPRFIWNKGKQRYTYHDWDKGIRFALLVPSEAEARRVIEQVLDCVTISPDWDNLRKGSESVTGEGVIKPKKVTVLGEVIDQPTKGKEGKVRFLSAQVFLYGKNSKPVHLYHAFGRYKNALIF